MRRLCSCAILAALLATAAPAHAAAAPSAATRTIAAKAFAQRTLRFQHARRLATPAAKRALAVRRRAAHSCLAVWQSAPLTLREDLGIVYFESLSGGLWSVDAPLYRSWIADLRRSTRIDRAPALARAGDALKRAYATAERAYTAFPDACATVTAWRDAGWTATARPPQLTALDAIIADEPSGYDTILSVARRQLARYAGRDGRLAAAILDDGIDETDDRVLSSPSCDPLGALLFPDVYPAGCA